MEHFDFWNESNELVAEAYRGENIKVVDYEKGQYCYIFFSSNGLYYPNTLSEFEEKVVKQNRFEWEHMALSREVLRVCKRAIFVRDIYKQYYVTGNSENYDSIDKLLKRLKELTEGEQIITIGSSAGGYMAMLAAASLGAVSCFSFSGQVFLYEQGRIDDMPFLKKFQDVEDRNKWYDIRKLVKNSKANLWYFYPANNEADRKEFSYIEDGQNVKGFAFNLSNHAETMYSENMKHIISKNPRQMEKIYTRYQGKVIDRREFLFRTATLFTIFMFYYKKVVRYVKKRIGK